MSATNRNILLAVAGLALILAFWFLILGPKRDRAAELKSDVSELEDKVAEQEKRAEFAEQARAEFPENYQKLVVLGKAVPQNSESASLLVQLNTIAGSSKVDFRGLELGDAPQSEAAAPAPTDSGTQSESGESSSSEESGSEGSGSESSAGESGSGSGSAPAAAPATEAAASTLAIGSTVGPAGLEVLPYKLRFNGDFFGLADFLQGVDRLISTSDGRTVVDGRLTTVDGFSLAADDNKGFPSLTASLSVTTYLAPPAQGLTGGATPSGPAPAPAGEDPLQTASTGGTP